MTQKQMRSVRLSGEQIRALIEAAHWARDHNETLSEGDCATLDLAREPLATALGNINFERNRNGQSTL
jgi:hypothetical protein